MRISAKRFRSILLVMFLLLFAGLFGRIQNSEAGPVYQDPTALPDQQVGECQSCHLDIAEMWSHSPHAHAFDDEYFQERWTGMGQPGECLLCHTTNYQETSQSYDAEGVACEACHGTVGEDHPPAVVPLRADTDYCGTCHTTTLGEWRLTGHASSTVGCMDCHDPHNQEALFTVADDMCINCHGEDMGDYLEDLHVQKEIGCVDCHALVIPPEIIPEDGIVPTGHAFTITPATCVACHTDALHAGFSLPGYENGASEAVQSEGEQDSSDLGEVSVVLDESLASTDRVRALEGDIQILQASLASESMLGLFQGGVIGLVLGGSTAWFVAHNLRRRAVEEEDEESEEGSS